MALTDQLVAFWALEEASGSRHDSWGSETLTSNNSVGQQTGKIDHCAHFTAASSQYLSHADDANLGVGGTDFSFAFWMYMDSASNVVLISKEDDTTPLLEYRIGWNGSTAYIQVANAAGSGWNTILYESSFGAMSTATWYWVYCEWDNTALKAGICINAGTLDQSAAFANGPTRHDGIFLMGAYNSGAPAAFMDGRLDEVGFWKRKLTSAERTQLYNGGAGLPFINALPLATSSRIYPPILAQ